ncbi:SinI family restriction endonuclease [Succinimonas sp.]|uniref:SinI family restriction endonuclease n=1 Tax=Succinimonas sp. TaxID=1936151 RepID=UPI0038645B91
MKDTELTPSSGSKEFDVRQEFDLSKISADKISADDAKNSGFDIVARAWLKDHPNATKAKKDKFVNKFFQGYRNRPSRRTGKPHSASPDPLVLKLVAALPGCRFSENDIARMHQDAMAVENITGALLEEYIAVNVTGKGWAICWGSTIRATDLVSDEGRKLQIKNKTNTENSSSRQVRKGTDIVVWHRLDANDGRYYWEDLNNIIGHGCCMSEEGFREFALKALKSNPKMINLNFTEEQTEQPDGA